MYRTIVKSKKKKKRRIKMKKYDSKLGDKRKLIYFY